MIGIVEDKKHITTIGFKEKGDLIFLIGENRNDISSSQYLVSEHNVEASPVPFFSLEEEYSLQEQIRMVIRKGLLASAHDVSEGGLFVALAEKAMASDLGFDVTTDSAIRRDAYLFGESQSRVIVSVNPENETAFIDLMMLNGVEFDLMGHVTKGAIRFDDTDWGTVAEYKHLYDNAIGDRLNK
jgi:phosphoribosylformylglycinamidine synthase